MASPSSNTVSNGWRSLYHHAPNNGVGLLIRERESDGLIECPCSTFQRTRPSELHMCNHVAHVIKNNLDADPEKGGIWDRNNPIMEVAVPVAKRPGLLVGVSLDEPDSAGQRGARLHMSRLGTQFLCYLNPGEGRRILKLMIVEMLSAFYSSRPECESPTHTNSVNVPPELLDPVSGDSLSDTWYLLSTGNCRICWEDRNPF